MKKNDLILLGAAVAGLLLLKKQSVNGIGDADVENYHLLTVKYMGANNRSGSRVKIESKRFGQSITIKGDNHFRDAVDQAIDYLQKKRMGYHWEG